MSTIFYVGATGYIGGSVLVALRKKFPTYSVTALVRNPKNFPAIEALGVAVVQGSFSDEEVIEKQSSLADIVINTGESDSVPLALAILRGLKQRHETTGAVGIYIHTSGCAAFLDMKKDGLFDPQGKLWDDSKEEDIRSITPDFIHGPIDTPILTEGDKGYVNTYILSPGAVVGKSTGPISNGSFFTKAVASIYKAMGGPVYVGEGSNEFLLVDLEDLVDIYLRVFELATSNTAHATSYSRYIFATSNGANWKDIAAVFGPELARRGVLKTSEPRILTGAQVPDGVAFLAASQRMVSKRAELLGWQPRKVNLADYVVDAVSELADVKSA
ncbi:NAD(P)-binding protein [Trametopsis cervina]|nr:NAD(P)-binding protein [Trametopsis cervina]